jgi:uncharacterized protein (TIGR00725 family)
MTAKIIISVIGPGEATPAELQQAETIGSLIAQKGAVLLCGGMGGVMEAACRGAAKYNGLTVGILPVEDRFLANKYVQIPIVTGMGQARNVVVARSGHAVIAIGGGYGTLSEIGHALRSGVPVVGLNTWSLVKNGRTDVAIRPTKSPAEAVELAFSIISGEKQ